MKVIAVIPSRYGSTRFPGKPLVELLGKPMVQWVYERASSCPSIDQVIVATDDQRIVDCVQAFGGEVMMTSSEHFSGTERLTEVLHRLDQQGEHVDLVLNVQGDEPAIDPDQLDALVGLFTDAPSTELGTLVTPCQSIEDFRNPDRVKALMGAEGRVLAFSRSPIPYDRHEPDRMSHSFIHLGVYAYRSEALRRIRQLPEHPLEQAELLEQLRWLAYGMQMKAQVVERAARGVDRPEDIPILEAELEKLVG